MSSMLDRFYERSVHLNILLGNDPAEAVKQAREIDLDSPERFNLMSLRAAILVDGGALTQQQDAIEEGLALFRELHSLFPTAGIIYNLANGLVATTGIYVAMKEGEFPASISVGARAIGWLSSDIDAWIENRVKVSRTA